jgi:hypothetical protein
MDEGAAMLTSLRIVVMLAGAAVFSHAQWLNYPTPGIPRTPDGKPNLTAPAPRAPDGKPDLSGIWAPTTSASGVRQLKASEIKPWALQLAQEREEALDRDSPGAQCLPAGPGPVGGLDKIVQTSALILILHEDLTYRQIFLDGRELPKDPNPAWMGYSAGRWEGDSLVVESAGYNDRTWFEVGYPHTESLRIIERFHRGNFGHITVDVTYSDPGAYDKPWTTHKEMRYRADTELLEYVCAENEKDRVHLVGKNSDELKDAVKVPPGILSKYVGTYVRYIPRGPQELTFALEDGAFTLSVAGGTPEPLTALSETIFYMLGDRFEFFQNDKGEVTHLLMVDGSGEWRADRKK